MFYLLCSGFKNLFWKKIACNSEWVVYNSVSDCTVIMQLNDELNCAKAVDESEGSTGLYIVTMVLIVSGNFFCFCIKVDENTFFHVCLNL